LQPFAGSGSQLPCGGTAIRIIDDE
jgi:hypothetical protein